MLEQLGFRPGTTWAALTGIAERRLQGTRPWRWLPLGRERGAVRTAKLLK